MSAVNSTFVVVILIYSTHKEYLSYIYLIDRKYLGPLRKTQKTNLTFCETRRTSFKQIISVQILYILEVLDFDLWIKRFKTMFYFSNFKT